MTRMTRPDCAVMCNLINIYTQQKTRTKVPLILLSIVTADGHCKKQRSLLIEFTYDYETNVFGTKRVKTMAR